jgi:hypothetical protein
MGFERDDYLDRLVRKKEMKQSKQEQNKSMWCEINKLSWIKKLQYKDSDGHYVFLEDLQRVEDAQKWAMQYYINHHYPERRKDWLVYFNDFWTKLLNEEVKSIKEYFLNEELISYSQGKA